MEGCPPSEILALIVRNDEAWRHLIAVLSVTLPGHHEAHLTAGLPRVLIAASEAAARAAPPEAGGAPPELAGATAELLSQLVCGPFAAGAADAIAVAPGGIDFLVRLLSKGKATGVVSVALCLRAITGGGPTHHSAVIAAGAVPPLLRNFGESSGNAARALADLMATSRVAVEAEGLAAGFDAAWLREIADGRPPQAGSLELPSPPLLPVGAL